jgi:proteasome lid subunit RPN8/RPN11
VLDDIRLGVVDAFFSLPRGGAEIGGVLLGRHVEGRVSIAEYLALDCEHAMGPSFVLSPRDESKLQELLDQVRSNPAGLIPVGWYHSHTRSEIFLSEADQEIHRRFFPEPWQVALVFKPHTFQPMRCGFFFRETDGSIHATSTYQEFLLEAMPLRPMPSGVVPSMLPNTPPMLHREPDAAAVVIDVSRGAPAPKYDEVAAPEQPEAAAGPVIVDPPKFVTAPPEDRSWLGLKVVLALAVGLGAGAFGFQTRQVWLPKLLGAAKSPAAPASLGLSTVDADGTLQIHWDRLSPAVQQGTAAVLTITDGGSIPREIQLDREHLRSGAFTYGRESEQVDVSLSVSRPNLPPVRAVAGFVGKAPSKPVTAAPDDSAQIARLKSDLAAQVEQVRKVEKLLADQSLLVSEATKMKNDLAAQVERSKKLETSLSAAQAQAAEAAKLRKELAAANDRVRKLAKDLTDAQNELKQQQRKRLGAQDPGK